MACPAPDGLAGGAARRDGKRRGAARRDSEEGGAARRDGEGGGAARAHNGEGGHGAGAARRRCAVSKVFESFQGFGNCARKFESLRFP